MIKWIRYYDVLNMEFIFVFYVIDGLFFVC